MWVLRGIIKLLPHRRLPPPIWMTTTTAAKSPAHQRKSSWSMMTTIMRTCCPQMPAHVVRWLRLLLQRRPFPPNSNAKPCSLRNGNWRWSNRLVVLLLLPQRLRLLLLLAILQQLLLLAVVHAIMSLISLMIAILIPPVVTMILPIPWKGSKSWKMMTTLRKMSTKRIMMIREDVSVPIRIVLYSRSIVKMTRPPPKNHVMIHQWRYHFSLRNHHHPYPLRLDHRVTSASRWSRCWPPWVTSCGRNPLPVRCRLKIWPSSKPPGYQLLRYNWYRVSMSILRWVGTVPTPVCMPRIKFNCTPMYLFRWLCF